MSMSLKGTFGKFIDKNGPKCICDYIKHVIDFFFSFKSRSANLRNYLINISCPCPPPLSFLPRPLFPSALSQREKQTPVRLTEADL